MNASWVTSVAMSASPVIRNASRYTRSTCRSYSARCATGSPAAARVTSWASRSRSARTAPKSVLADEVEESAETVMTDRMMPLGSRWLCEECGGAKRRLAPPREGADANHHPIPEIRQGPDCVYSWRHHGAVILPVARWDTHLPLHASVVHRAAPLSVHGEVATN